METTSLYLPAFSTWPIDWSHPLHLGHSDTFGQPSKVFWTRPLSEKRHILRDIGMESRSKFRLVVAGTIIFFHLCTKNKTLLLWLSFLCPDSTNRQAKNKQKTPHKISYLKPELRGIISIPNFALYANVLPINFFLYFTYKAIPKGEVNCKFWEIVEIQEYFSSSGTEQVSFSMKFWVGVFFVFFLGFFYSSVS